MDILKMNNRGKAFGRFVHRGPLLKLAANVLISGAVIYFVAMTHSYINTLGSRKIRLVEVEGPAELPVLPLVKLNAPPVDWLLPPVRRRLPQAFLLGAGKCGTGALRKFLTFHPNVVVPASEEMWFYYTMFEKGETWHLEQMPVSKPNQITVECSPAYFHNPSALDRIKMNYQKALFFVILRDPVDRAVSHFLHDYYEGPRIKMRQMNETEIAADFEKLVMNEWFHTDHLIDYGIYSKVLKRWMKVIPQSRIHVMDGSSFLRNPYPELKLLEKFLGLPDYFNQEMFVRPKERPFYCFKARNDTLNCMNKRKGRKHPPIKKSVLEKLSLFYEPHNEELFSLIQRRFTWGTNT